MGIVTALVGGVIAAIYSVIYTTVIDPNYYEKVVEVTMEKMSAFTSNFSEEQMEELREKTLQKQAFCGMDILFIDIGLCHWRGYYLGYSRSCEEERTSNASLMVAPSQ